MERRFITAADGIVIALLLLAAAIFLFAPKGDRLEAEITYEGQTRVISLDGVKEEYELPIRSNGHDLILKVAPGGIEVLSSTCPDGICMQAGRLDRAGQCAICLPARLVVRIRGVRESGVDAVL